MPEPITGEQIEMVAADADKLNDLLEGIAKALAGDGANLSGAKKAAVKSLYETMWWVLFDANGGKLPV